MLVSRNMVSAMLRNVCTSGSRCPAGSDDSARPNSTEKKMIGRMSPCAIAANTFDGTRLRIVDTRLCGPCCTSAVVFWYCEISLAVSRSEEYTSELQSLMRISYAVFCLKKKKYNNQDRNLHYIYINTTYAIR